MVEENYTDDITSLSERELESVFQTVEPPACLLGGWAVHLHVNEAFQDTTGREYIGSRDIDIGFHVEPSWDENELVDAPVGKSLTGIEALGYTRARFGFLKTFDRETGEVISEDEVQSVLPHQRFDVHVDILPDTEKLDAFVEAFGFRPPDEQLLRHAFEDGAAGPLSVHRSWELPETILIVDPDLLGAMKIRSAPQRDKDEKLVKDVADLHALLWYVGDYHEMRTSVRSWVSESDIQDLMGHLSEQVYRAAANLLGSGVDHETVQDSIEQLGRD